MPCHAILVEGIGVLDMGTTAMDVKDKVKAKAPDMVDDPSTKYHVVHSLSGDIKYQFLLVLSNKDTNDAFVNQEGQDIIE